MSRALLHISKLDQFRDWLTAQGIESRDGRGDYQVAQVKLTDGQWACVYSRNEMPEHFTTDKRLDRLVQRFCNARKAS